MGTLRIGVPEVLVEVVVFNAQHTIKAAEDGRVAGNGAIELGSGVNVDGVGAIGGGQRITAFVVNLTGEGVGLVCFEAAQVGLREVVGGAARVERHIVAVPVVGFHQAIVQRCNDEGLRLADLHHVIGALDRTRNAGSRLCCEEGGFGDKVSLGGDNSI